MMTSTQVKRELLQKIDAFESNKEGSVETVKSFVSFLRSRLDIVEKDLIVDINREFGENIFAQSLSTLTDPDAPQQDIEQAVEISKLDVPRTVGPTEDALNRLNKEISVFRDWKKERKRNRVIANVPPIPLPKSISACAPTMDTVEVVWEEVKGYTDTEGATTTVTCYCVEMRKLNEGAFHVAYNGTNTMCRIGGLENEATYFVRMRTKGKKKYDGEEKEEVEEEEEEVWSEWSEVMEVTTPGVPVPQHLSATVDERQGNAVCVRWDNVVVATGKDLKYIVEMRSECEREMKEVYKGKCTEWRGEGLDADTEYIIRVRAEVNVSGAIKWGKWSSPVCVKTKNVSTPCGLKSVTLGCNAIKMCWNRAICAEVYALEIKASNSGTYQEVYRGSNNVASVSSLNVETEYTFRVRGEMRGKKSEWSAPVVVRTSRWKCVWKEGPYYKLTNGSTIATKDTDGAFYGLALGNVAIPPNRVTT